MRQRLYRFIFWTGYFAVLITTFLPVKGELNKINIGPDAFHIRLDHLLHLFVYFLICMYFLFGLERGLFLFTKNHFIKFVLVILLLGTITEIIQLWVPERAFNPMDLLANVSGIFVGIVVILFYGKTEGLRDER